MTVGENTQNANSMNLDISKRERERKEMLDDGDVMMMTTMQ